MGGGYKLKRMKNSIAGLAIVGAAAVGASLVVADLPDELSPAIDSFNTHIHNSLMSSRVCTEADMVEGGILDGG